MRHWYLIQTKPRQEQKARRHLDEQQYETYLPRCILYRIRRSRRVQVEEPLFPGYLFIHLDPQNENWGPIRSTPGVSRLVRFGQMPAQVPNHCIQAIQANENAAGLHEIPDQEIVPGDRVRLLDGALAGLEGVFVTPKGQDRALILMTVLGKLTQVEVARSRLVAS